MSEELQSCHEDLSTVNHQLGKKVDELESANDDLTCWMTSTDIATLLLATNHTIQRFTPPATRLFNLTPSDVGRPIDDISAHINDSALPGDIDEVLRTLMSCDRELHNDEGRCYLRRITLYRTADNCVGGVVVMYIEISALKRAEDDLRTMTSRLEDRVSERTTLLEAQRDFMKLVQDSIVEAILTVNEHGVVLSINRAGMRMFGYAANDVIGRKVNMLMPEPYRSEHDAYITRYLQGGKPHVIGVGREIQGLRNDGSTFPVWLNVSEIVRDGLRLFVGTLHDLTEQRRIEYAARERQEELTLLHRVYTAGEFAAVMAHELSQPLTAISGYSEAGLQHLRRGQVEPDGLIDKFEKITLQTQRAGQVIRELRKFLTRDAQQREPVELNALIRSVIELLTPQALARNVRIKFMPSAAPITIMALEVQIEHVLVNLVQNAIEAIQAAGKAAGTITIRTSADPGDMVHVTVQDDGPGFTGDAARRLFERFYTTKPKGLGMGLAICRSIIEAYDGQIRAEQPMEGGTVFHFTLPHQA